MAILSDAEVRALLPHLQRFALWLTRNPHSAEDLVQSCLMKALSHANRPEDEPTSLRPWLFAILYRQFIDGERRRKRYHRLLAFFSRDEAGVDQAEGQAIADQTLAQFAALPTDYRAVLLLVSVEGLSYKEAAQALDIPVGTVMSRLSRARSLWHDKLADQPVAQPLRRLK